MSDINCPYCGAEQEIDHDDGCGYEEDVIHEQRCDCCEKLFVFTASISYYYEAGKDDCLNGGKHQYKETITYPRIYTKLVCSSCGEMQPLSDERLKQIINEENKSCVGF